MFRGVIGGDLPSQRSQSEESTQFFGQHHLWRGGRFVSGRQKRKLREGKRQVRGDLEHVDVGIGQREGDLEIDPDRGDGTGGCCRGWGLTRGRRGRDRCLHQMGARQGVLRNQTSVQG